MIGLEFRRKPIVDTSGWDQSFVDGGGGSTRGRDLARVTSGPEVGSSAAAAPAARKSSSRCAFEDELPFPVGSRALPESGTIRCAAVDGATVRRRPVTVRAVNNPFLVRQERRIAEEGKGSGGSASATEMIQVVRQRSIPEVEESTTGNDRPTSDVSAWLLLEQLIESPRLLLNCSTSNSPSICDDVTTGSSRLLDDDTAGDRISGCPSRPRAAAAAAAAGVDPPSHDDAPLEPYSRAVSFLPSWDIDRLRTVYSRLDASGFYLGRMSMDEARRRLAGYPVGTFLLRDSSDRRFLFSLSVQTRRGTTSIRILYESGQFRLDSDPEQLHLMPTFECVLLLVGHYILPPALPRSTPSGSKGYVFREATGRRDTPVLLRRALETTPATLAHLCRKRIHRSLGRSPKGVGRLHLKPSLKSYLAEYPYDI